MTISEQIAKLKELADEDRRWQARHDNAPTRKAKRYCNGAQLIINQEMIDILSATVE